MGASGSGKSTLLNVLNGAEQPSSGRVMINGIDIHQHPEKVEGVVGYIPQDDLLMEDLTVFENLYYAAQLCFGQHTKEGNYRTCRANHRSAWPY
jgi:ABC-type multidrug transport system ATPase subunit